MVGKLGLLIIIYNNIFTFSKCNEVLFLLLYHMMITYKRHV